MLSSVTIISVLLQQTFLIHQLTSAKVPIAKDLSVTVELTFLSRGREGGRGKEGDSLSTRVSEPLEADTHQLLEELWQDGLGLREEDVSTH